MHHPKKRALISVSDKTGLIPLAKTLHDVGFELVSTGGTQKALEEAGLLTTHVESITQFPECFGGRVKTMHPSLMGGILFRRDHEQDQMDAGVFGMQPIDVVVVNLYPFRETLKKHPHDGSIPMKPELIEQIDIGGPTLLRSAAKNYASVTVLSDPADYEEAMIQFKAHGNTTLEYRHHLASKVFAHTSAYDQLIAETFLPPVSDSPLRYGENPHQKAVFRSEDGCSSWNKLQGKELSYLNLFDADAAWQAVLEFSEPAAVFVKHANPCGVATRHTIDEAFSCAYECDPLSAFGVIIALNRPCTEHIARYIIEKKMFIEVLMAPSFTHEALEILKEKQNLRILSMGTETLNRSARTVRSVPSFHGDLIQDQDDASVTIDQLQYVTTMRPTPEQIDDLLFAWKVVKHVKSNAIVLAKEHHTVGIGAGQTSRVDATWIAAKRAGDEAKGSVLASDAFFPFPDSLEEAANVGVSAIIQPGGSIRDEEVIARAEELRIPMVLTGIRAFRH